MDIAANIKRLRQYYGFSQLKLADYMGISQQNIAQYENGKRKPKYETLIKFSECFDCNVSFLYDEDLTKMSNDDISYLLFSKYGGANDPEHDEIIFIYEKLNKLGKNKAIEQLKLLAKIPEYQKVEDIKNS